MRRNWPFLKDSDWLILVFVHSAKPTAELENLAMSPSLSSPGLSYDTKIVHIGWELRSLVGDTILGVQSEPACNQNIFKDPFGHHYYYYYFYRGSLYNKDLGFLSSRVLSMMLFVSFIS